MEESITGCCNMCRHLGTVKCPFCCQTIKLGFIQLQEIDPSETLYQEEEEEEVAISVHPQLTNRITITDVQTHRSRDTDGASAWEWTFLLTNLGLEIVSAAFDQFSSPRKPLLALIAMVVSGMAVLVCILELVHKARHQGVVLRRLNQIIWCFYHPSPSNDYRLFCSFVDVYGLICAMSQFIFSVVKYSYLHHHSDDPIKLSILPVIFLACVAGFRLGKNHDVE